VAMAPLPRVKFLQPKTIFAAGKKVEKTMLT
jgi:hypothetical protein